MFAALALSASAPLLADDGDTKHEDAAQHEGKEEGAKPAKGDKKKGTAKHAGHHHAEKNAEKNGGEKK
jgi:hypothetical protein